MRPALTTSLLIHTSQRGRAQKSCLSEILPSPRAFEASPIPELTGSRHSLQRLPGLARFNNSFEQGQLTCSFFGEMWNHGGAQEMGVYDIWEERKEILGSHPPKKLLKSNSYLVKGANSSAQFS